MSAISEFLARYDDTPWFPGREPSFDERLANEVKDLLLAYAKCNSQASSLSSELGWIKNPDRMGQ